MKVLRVIGSMDPKSGGPCQGIRNSVPELARNGVFTEVVSLDNPTEIELSKDQFPIFPLGHKGAWKYSEKLLPWLERNLLAYDVIIVHGLWLYHSYAVIKALRKLKKSAVDKHSILPKVFIMPHGMLDPYFQRATGRRIKAIRNWFYWKLIESSVVNSADGLLFTCEEELKLARLPFKPYYPKNELNVGYGIIEPPIYSFLMDRAFEAKCSIADPNGYLLYLSRIHEKKGVDLLIKGYIKLIEDGRFSSSQIPSLVIGGPGLDTPFGKSLLEMVKKNSAVLSKIWFPGMLTGDAKWGAFYGCEAFILPSHQENFGISVVEALACGKPVLISDQVNICTEIRNNEAGLVETDTLQGTIRLLTTWFLFSAEQKQKISQQARLTFERNFGIGKNADRLFTTLSSFIN